MLQCVVGAHEYMYMKQGNMKQQSRSIVCELVEDAWDAIPSEIFHKVFPVECYSGTCLTWSPMSTKVIGLIRDFTAIQMTSIKQLYIDHIIKVSCPNITT